MRTIKGNFTPYDVYAADEAFIRSTTPVIVPATSLNGAQISGAESTGGAALPGPVTLQLMKRLAEIAGMYYVSQAISRLGDNSSRDLAAAWEKRTAAT